MAWRRDSATGFPLDRGMSSEVSASRGAPVGSARHFDRRQRVKLFLIGLLGWTLIRTIGLTLRYRTEGGEDLQRFKDDRTPVIYSFWHNQIFLATVFWRFRNIAVITSHHFDGEYIARIIGKFGYQAVRGSARRGGAEALLQLRSRLDQGQDVAFTVDGPRGPIYQVKRGPLWLSRRTGAPIVPFHMQPKHFWQLGSWDEFRIPKPFSPVLVKIGQPLVVTDRGGDDFWMARYQGEMKRIQEWCESRWRQQPD